MNKKLLLIFITILLITVSYLVYIKYTDIKINEYLKYYHGDTLINFFNGEVQGEAKLVRVIKRSPLELIMIIKWDNARGYITVQNWLTKAHDSGEISIFDKNKSMKFYE
jgi:hypothetical protein